MPTLSSSARGSLTAAGLSLLAGLASAGPATTWLQPAHDAAQSWNNPDEKTLRPGNVRRLALASSQQPGRFFAGPATQSDGKLFLCTDENGLTEIDLATNTAAWMRFDFGGGNCNAAVLDATTAYVTASSYSPGTWTNTLTAVARSDGGTRWQMAGPPDPPFPAASWLGFNVPTLHKGALYVTHGRSLVSSYDAASGALRWRAETGLLNNQAAVADGLVIASTWNGAPNRLFAFDAASGAPAWSRVMDSSNSEYPAAAAGGRVFVGADSGLVRAFRSATGAPLWEAHLGGYVSAPLVATSDALIVNTGASALTALDAATGATLWSATLQGSDHVSSNLALANAVLYFTATNFSGEQRLSLYDARTGTRIARLPDAIFGSYSSVSVTGGRVYVSANGSLMTWALP